MASPWIAIGRVRSVNPKAREVRVEIQAGYAEAFEAMAWIRFDQPPAPPLRCKVASARGNGTVAVVRLAPGLPRDAVGGLRGARVIAASDELPRRGGGKWVLEDLIGMAVVLPGGEVLGTVCEVYAGPANDAFAVDRADGSRCVLPLVEALVRAVSREAGRVEVGDVAPFIVDM